MRSRRHRHLWALAVVVALTTAVVSACSTGHTVAVPANGCAPGINERLDPRSTIHLFPGAPEPTYLSDPPTSGPHRLGPPYTGVVSSPIPRPSQVAMLESGYIILQSQGLPPAQAATLDGLAGTLVTVAPPVAKLPSAVVATAWTWKLECGSVTPGAVTAIRAFIGAHKGVGFFGNFPASIPTTTSTSTSSVAPATS
jgi:hypothetical protein